MRTTRKQRWLLILAAVACVGVLVIMSPQQAADFVRALGQAFGGAGQ